jgi:AcrR family transcriptional regulator
VSGVDVREQLLQAALRVYAVAGARGATTRRIAHEAGVNEVTLFRHFGSKDTLLQEALAWDSRHAPPGVQLPADPVDPEQELLEFCRVQHGELTASRSLIRTSMAEFSEHPDSTRMVCQAPVRLAEELQQYLVRLRAAGLAGGDWQPRAAAAMLMGTLFADAMGRDCMPERYPAERDAIRQYVSLFLRAIGATAAPPRARG